MNDHDRDLILGLATGSLSETDAAAARARIDADPELAAELAEQQAAIEALSTVEPVAMTADERATLRSDLIAQLHLEDAPAAAAAAPAAAAPQRAAWWKPVFGLGAAAVFVTAIVIVPGMIGGSDDSADSGFEAATGELDVTTTIAATSAQEFEESGGAADASPSGAGEDGAAPDGSDILPFILGRSATDSLDLASVDEADSDQSRRFESCRDAVTEELGDTAEVTVLGVSPFDDDRLYLGVDEGAGIGSVATIDLSDCSVIDLDR